MIYLTDYFSIYTKKIKNYLYYYLYLSSRLFIKYCLTDFFLNITKKILSNKQFLVAVLKLLQQNTVFLVFNVFSVVYIYSCETWMQRVT